MPEVNQQPAERRAFCLGSEESMTVDQAESRRLAALVAARDKKCYANALFAQVVRPDLIYVEGLAITDDSRMIEHAWLETAAGDVIIDPTPIFAESPACAYFGAARFTQNQAKSVLWGARGGVTPLVTAPWDDARFQAAWGLAKRYLRIGDAQHPRK
jgi:hypothetical protein